MAWSRLAMLPELIDCQAAMTAELVIGHPCKAVAKNKKIRRTKPAKNQEIERSQDAIKEHL